MFLHITYLFIFSASNGLKVNTHKQKISWYCTWKLTRLCSTASRVEMPSTETKAKRYSSILSIICKQRATDCIYSLFYTVYKKTTTMKQAQIWYFTFVTDNDTIQIVFYWLQRQDFDTSNS